MKVKYQAKKKKKKQNLKNEMSVNKTKTEIVNEILKKSRRFWEILSRTRTPLLVWQTPLNTYFRQNGKNLRIESVKTSKNLLE